MRQGDRRGNDIDFADFTYDGDVTDGYLSGGLGQLTDTEEGMANFRLHQSPDGGSGVVTGNVRRRGYEWVGWRADEQRSLPVGVVSTSGTVPVGSSIAPPVEISFAFDGPRRITGVRIHCHNALSRDVAVFRAAELRFYLDDEAAGTDQSSTTTTVGGGTQSRTVYHEHQRDTTSEQPRYVDIPIQSGGRLARHVRLLLYFDLRWIMISEIRFDTGRCASV